MGWRYRTPQVHSTKANFAAAVFLTTMTLMMMAARLFLIVSILLATLSISLASSSSSSSTTTRRNNLGIIRIGTGRNLLPGGFLDRHRHRHHSRNSNSNNNEKSSGDTITKLSLQSSSGRELEEISSSSLSATSTTATTTTASPVKNVIPPPSRTLSFLTLPGRQQRSRRHNHQRRRQQQPNQNQRRWLYHRRSSSSALQQSLVDDDDGNNDNDDVTTFGMEGISKKQLIEIKSQVELPFSAEVAYDAYSNLPRQPQWSSWLDSVVFLEKRDDEGRETTNMDRNPTNNSNDLLESRWTMKFLGIRYTFEAVAVRNERPRVMQWKSTTGLKNFGTVRFHPREKDQNNDDVGGGGDNNENETTTLMTLTMTFVAPRAVSAVFRKNTKIASYVERNLITKSLYDFRDVVVKTDLRQQQQTKNEEETSGDY